MEINEKELVKQIRSSKNRIVWSIQEEEHFITNRVWAVRYKKLPTAVLTALFAIFAEIPENNTTLHTTSGIPQKSEPVIDIRKIMEPGHDLVPAQVTKIVLDIGIKARCFVGSDGQYFYLDESLVQLGNVFDGNVLYSKPRSPVFLCDGNLIILPVRVGKVEHIEIIQNLLDGVQHGA